MKARSGPYKTRPDDVRTVRGGGLVVSLAVISIALAAAVAFLISGVKEALPVVGGLDYKVLQVGLVVLVLAFSLYTFERERRVRLLSSELENERVEAEKLNAQLGLLKEVETERDTVTALLTASADGIMVVDPDRRVVRSNPAIEELVGRGHEASIGRTCEELFGCLRDGRLSCGSKCPFERVIASGETIVDHSFQSVRPAGQPVWVSGAYAPVRDPDGNIAFAIGSLRDVTRNKEVEQLQHDFVSIVSHELRGPLTAIKGFIKTLLMKSGKLTHETQMDFLSTINEQADRLNQLVEDLLNVSRIESRRLKMTLTEVDLEVTTRKLLNQFRSKWGDRVIVLEAHPNLPMVRADESKVDEILINLIDNSVKYSPGGGDVKISMWPTQDSVEISIEDSGIGMAPEDAAKLFEKFHRIATVETRDIGGTGLGLFIVKNLVEAHGGSIVVSSAPSVGTTFTFSLPLRGPAEAVDR